MTKVAPEKALEKKEGHEHKEEGKSIPKGGLVTFGVALFFHSFIDGLTIGVFNDVS